MNEQASTAPISDTGDRRRLYVGLGLLAGLALLLIIGIVVILFVDPFGWGLLRLAGEDAAAEAMPYDTALYLHFDLLSLTDEDLDAIVKTFSEEFEAEGVTVTDKWNELMDEFLSEELDMTYSEDIVPWIGDDIGFGLYNLTLDQYGMFEGVEILFAVEVRNADKADTFLSKVTGVIAEEGGEPVQEATYEGRTIYYLEAPYGGSFALCRSENHILISEDQDGIQLGIDAQMGKSLADHEGYVDAIKALPDETMFTFYLSMSAYAESLLPVLESVYGPGSTDLLGGAYGEMTVLAASLSFVDVGVRFDSAMIFDTESLEQAPDQYFNTDPRTASMAPQDTFFYLTTGITARSAEQSMEDFEAIMGAEGADLEEALAFFEASFGFDPINDLLANLSGEVAILIVPDSKGAIAESLHVPIGFAMMFETDNPQALLEVADSLSAVLEAQGVGEVELTETEHATFYNLVDMFYAEPLVTFGVSDEFLLIGSSAGALDDLFIGGPSLAEDEGYQRVWDEFPKGMAPVMFVDIEGIVAQVRETLPPMEREGFDQEIRGGLRPITFLAGAVSPLEDGAITSITILFIEME